MAQIKCPKCGRAFDASPDELGLMTCPECGAKLRSKTPMKMTVQGTPPPAPPAAPAADRTVPTDVDSVLARLETEGVAATIRPGALRAPKAPAPAPSAPATLETVMAELRAIRGIQEQILGLLGTRQPGDGTDRFRAAAQRSASRADGRKLVLLIDDEAQSRHETEAALSATGLAVKTAVDGNGGLAAIAVEKPDAIVLELGLAGSLPGRDVVNLIKATMDWLDIPIVLFTRVPIADESEARELHGADAWVPKGPGAAAGLAKRVGSLLAHR